MRLPISKKALGIIFFGISLLLLVNHFIIQHVYYVIDIDADSSSDISLRYISDDGSLPEPTSLFGLYMIPREVDTIVAIDSARETRHLIESKPLVGVGNVQISLSSQRAISKIGKNGLGCNGVSSENQFFTYSCFDATDDVYKYANKPAGEFENRLIQRAAADSRLSTKPYEHGLLSVAIQSGAPTLQYTDMKDGGVKTLKLEGGIESIYLFTNSSDGSFVVVNNPSHQVTYFSDIDSAPRVFNISKEIVYSSCDVSKKYLLCSASPAEVLAVNEEGSHDAANLELVEDAKILYYDMNSGERTDYDTQRLVDRVCLTGDGFYSLEDDEKLFYYPENSKRQSLIATGVKSVSCDNSMLLYTNGTSIFKTHRGTARLAFHEERFSISTIQQVSNKIVFTAYLDDEPGSPLHTYKLSSDDASLPRIESSLPYSVTSDLPILEMDYDDTNIYIKPQVSITSDRVANKTIIDQTALVETKQIIERRLRSDNLLDSRSLVYYLN